MPKFARLSATSALLVLLFTVTPLHAQTVTLAWDPNTESNLAGYLIGYGRTPGLDEQFVNVGFSTQWTLNGLMPSQRYYFRVYAMNTEGLRSAPSAEVSALIGGSDGSGGSTSTGCSTPDPFVALGGGTCVNGGWMPPSTGAPAPAPSPAPAPFPAPAPAPWTGGCLTPDPFVSLGGGTCINGGWLPRSTGAPAPAPVPAPAPAPSTGGCTTPNPFVSLGGGTCFNGGWLPPGMSPPVPFIAAPAPAPGGLAGCATPDPFVSLGGGTCINGGWIPPGMQLPGSFALTSANTTPARDTSAPIGQSTPEGATNSSAAAVTTATSPIVIGSSTSAKPTAAPAAEATMAPATTSSKIDEGCTSRDPFVGLPGLIGECVNGRWVSVPGVSTTGTVYLFDIDGAFWGILGDDGKVYRPMGGLPQNLQKARARVSFDGKFVGEVASPDRVVLIDVRKVTAR